MGFMAEGGAVRGLGTGQRVITRKGFCSLLSHVILIPLVLQLSLGSWQQELKVLAALFGADVRVRCR